jgi:hypothetical protein
MKKLSATLKLYAKELVISALFAAAFIFALMNIAFIHNLADGVLKTSSAAVSAAESGDYERAQELSQSALDAWRKGHNRMHIFLRHETVWSVETALVTLHAHAQERDADGVALARGTMQVAMNAITEIEQIAPGSVF